MRPSFVRESAAFRAAFLACFVCLWLVAACSSTEPGEAQPQTNQCTAPNQVCNGACTNVATSALHCGACGKVCAAGQACSAGVCSAAIGSAGNAGASAGGSTNGGAAAQGGTASAGSASGGAPAGGTSTAGTANGGTSTSGSANGGTASAGTSAGGNAGSGSSGGSGGGGTSVPEATSCPKISWPSANGSKNLGSGIKVGGSEVYDGGMAVHEGSLEDCSAGDQDSVDPLIEVANGGTVKNVIMGKKVGDGIHCLGSCTIENVWFPNVCDDAISAMGSGTVSIKNSGFKNARDKTIQHNGTATVNIDTVYVETAGKLYRSCGEGCSGSAKRSATLSNIVAIGVDQVAGVSENDTVTMKNICVHRTFSICSMYEPGTSTESTKGVSGSNEGPSTNCKFTAADTHALLSKVSGVPFTTEAVCGGPNGYKSGSTATDCVAGFDKCLKACAPGGYGFKEISCKSGRYSEGTGPICALPTEPTAAQNLAPARVMSGASAMVSNNGECSTEWGLGIESSNNANYCVCVRKPGYYKHDNWLSWDCQRRWW
jgi:pectate lyase